MFFCWILKYFYVAFFSFFHKDKLNRVCIEIAPSLDNSKYSSKNSSNNKSGWKPLRKLKSIFKSSTKLTESEVYNETYLQNKSSINQNPIYIAESTEEELQEVTGFPHHQGPFYRQNLGIVVIQIQFSFFVLSLLTKAFKTEMLMTC